MKPIIDLLLIFQKNDSDLLKRINTKSTYRSTSNLQNVEKGGGWDIKIIKNGYLE
jgi:hypothetical protein